MEVRLNLKSDPNIFESIFSRKIEFSVSCMLVRTSSLLVLSIHLILFIFLNTHISKTVILFLPLLHILHVSHSYNMCLALYKSIPHFQIHKSTKQPFLLHLPSSHIPSFLLLTSLQLQLQLQFHLTQFTFCPKNQNQSDSNMNMAI